MNAPHSPNDVVRQLSALAHELGQLTESLNVVERDAALKRHAADMAESRAFLNADGPMDIRRHQARVDSDKQEEAALVVEATVRVVRAQIRAVTTRIDIGRTYGATIRAELSTLGGQT